MSPSVHLNDQHIFDDGLLHSAETVMTNEKSVLKSRHSKVSWVSLLSTIRSVSLIRLADGLRRMDDLILKQKQLPKTTALKVSIKVVDLLCSFRLSHNEYSLNFNI